MKARRLVVAATVGAFVLLDVTVGPASAAPVPVDPIYPTYPTGTFSVVNPVEYVYDPQGWRPSSAGITVKILGLSDDTTAPKDLVIKAYSGTEVGRSSNGELWSATDPVQRLRYGGALDEDPFPPYDLPGSYHPYVTLTDEDGHTTRVDLPTVTLLADLTPPVVRIAVPKGSKRHTVRAWRNLHGTVIDAGIDRPQAGGRPYLQISVMQKRHGRFYYYDIAEARWRRGQRTELATFSKNDPWITPYTSGATGWYTGYLRGLTRGRLLVRTSAGDQNLNSTSTRARYTLTRRR